MDASALLELLLVSDAGASIRDVVTAPATQLNIPALCDIEVVAGLRRAKNLKALTDERAALALGQYLDLPLRRHGHRHLVPRLFALRSNFSPYDATYVALAETLDAELLTADKGLKRAVASGRVTCRLA